MSGQNPSDSNSREEKKPKGFSLPVQVFLGALAGVAAGLFAGDFMRFVEPIGNAYVQLLAMCVYPYLIASLLHGLGRLDPATARRLFSRAWFSYVAGWGAVLAGFMLLSFSFPSAGSPTEIVPESAGRSIDLVSILVPGNLFAALSRNYVPAVVLFALLYGLAMQRFKNKRSFLEVTENIKKASVLIWRWVVLVSPVGVFALFAGTAGTLSLHQVQGVLLYITVFSAGAALLAFWVLPTMISAMTDIPYRDIMRECRDGLVLSLVTTLSVVSLPAITRAAEKFAEEKGVTDDITKDVVGTNLAIAYPFAQFGNLVVLIFILFCAFYYQSALSAGENLLVPFLVPIATIGSPSTTIDAVAFLSGLLHMPNGSDELYVATMTFTRYGQVALSVMGFAFCTIVSTLSFYGKLKINLLKFAVVLLAAFAAIGGIALGLRLAGPELRSGSVHAYMKLGLEHTLTSGVSVKVYKPGETLPEEGPDRGFDMDSIRRSGVLRVSYHDALIPFCYTNARGELVGHDVAFMVQLARDLNVRLEFIPVRWEDLKEGLRSHRVDIAMGAIFVTPDRLRDLNVSKTYYRGPLAILARSEVADRLTTREKVREATGLTVGYFGSPVLKRLTQDYFPKNRQVEIASYDDLPKRTDIDAVVWSFAMARAFARSHPGFTAVVPEGMTAPVSMAYCTAPHAGQLAGYLDDWLDLQQTNGFAEKQKKHWINGVPSTPPTRRWCVIRDVLHWVE